MRTIARSTSLLVLGLVPCAAGGGCFSSSSVNSNNGAHDAAVTDSSTATGDALVDSLVNEAQPPAEAAPADAAPDQKAPPPPSAGGTGAFGIITVGGKQKMYLPQRTPNAAGNAFITVVDVGAPGNGVNGAPAQITTIDLGSPSYATATGGDSTIVIAVSTDFNNVYFIDPTTDTLVKTLTLDSSYGTSSFSGGGGYVTGVAVDSANHRAFLSVWNGIAIVDLSTKTIATVIQAPPTENFGFDSVHQRIIAPFYDCGSSSAPNPDGGSPLAPSTCNNPMGPEGGMMTDGLSIIDLTDNTVYTYELSAPAEDGGFNGAFLDPNAPVGIDPDSAAADPTTGVIVIPSEGSAFQSVIDLSRATFDKATKTVTAPQSIIPNLYLDAVAIEPNKHLAFWEQEFSSDIAVADLSQANLGGTASVYATMPGVPGGATFSNIGDPHGIAVTTALTSGGPVGFVVDSQLQWIARIDLAGMLAAGTPDASSTLSNAMVAPYVTFLDALTPENGGDAGSEGGSDAGGQ